MKDMNKQAKALSVRVFDIVYWQPSEQQAIKQPGQIKTHGVNRKFESLFLHQALSFALNIICKHGPFENLTEAYSSDFISSQKN